MAKGKAAVVIRIPQGENQRASTAGKAGKSANGVEVRSGKKKEQLFLSAPLLTYSAGRYRQVRGKTHQCFLLTVPIVAGLTVKEKLGGERECGSDPERAREGENGRFLIQSRRGRRR